MKFIYYPKCSTCIKAKKYLDANSVQYEARDIVADQLNKEEIRELYQKSGLPLKKFFNTSGLLYKEMNLKVKLPLMREEEMLDLLASNGKMVKRPILETEDTVLVGFKEEKYKEVL